MYIQRQWTVPCVFRNSEIMLFSFRLPVVVSVGLLSVPFVTLQYIIITCFCCCFSFILNTNKRAILAKTKEEKIKVQIEVLDEKLTGAILRQKSMVR